MDWHWDHEQLTNASIIVSEGQRLGASPRDIQIALMTAMTESSLHNLSGGDLDSVGLFQQRDAWGTFAERHDPAAAAKMFFTGGHEGQRGLFDITDREHLTPGEAAQAVQVSAYPDAYAKYQGDAAQLVQQLDHHPIETTSVYDQIDNGSAIGAQRDSDHDGLSDAFERAIGTNPHEADTDHDGLSDGYEVAISHSNPLAADSDHDGLSDSTEVAFGLNPMSWDTDHDGISDKTEIEYGLNPLVADTGDGVTPTAGQPTLPTPADGTTGSTGANGGGGPTPVSFRQTPTEAYQKVMLSPATEYHRFTLHSSATSSPIVLNGRTIAMLDSVDQHLGVNLSIVQGSYSTSVSASGGTHAGGGAIDVNVAGMSQDQINRTVNGLRAEGFAAWYRTTSEGFDIDHIHAIAIGDRQMSSAAASQVTDYYDGRTGLSGEQIDPMSHGKPGVFSYDAWLAEEHSGLGTTTTAAADLHASSADSQTKADEFVQAAVAQRGDEYIYGHEVSLTDPNPKAFDCSELTQWAAAQAGVTIPDGAINQYLDLKQHHALIPVSEALKTPGALLFVGSGGSSPDITHVAISLGNGKTIEALGTSYGVNEFSAAGRFQYAGVVPGMSSAVLASHATTGTTLTSWTSTSTLPTSASDGGYDQMPTGAAPETPRDSDHDGLSNAFERLAGTNPHSADTDHDGLSDAEEALVTHTDPLSADTDHDGRSDKLEVAQGTDPGHLVGTAGVVGTGIFAQNARDGLRDSDHDGLSDVLERRLGTNPHSADTDHDGLSDSTEVAFGLNPNSADTDHDGLTDGFEVQYGLDPLHGPDPTAGAGLGTDPTSSTGTPLPDDGGTDPVQDDYHW